MNLSADEYLERYFPLTKKSFEEYQLKIILINLMEHYNKYLNGDKFHYI